MARVAVIGGGVAGLAAAWALRLGGAEAVVFESAPRLGGRAITKAHGNARFDAGAQFFRTDTPGSHEAILEALPAAPEDIRDAVAPFAADGSVLPGDPAQNAEPKWVYRDGIGRLSTLLYGAGRPTVHLGWRVDALVRRPGGWWLRGVAGDAGPFEAVVCALPGPAAAGLLERSEFETTSRDALVEALAGVRYRSIISLAFGAEGDDWRPEGTYALVNVDRGHAISWLAFEHRKPGYVPDGQYVVVAQMADSWSRPRLAESDGALTADAWSAVRGLLGGGEPMPRWSDVTRWEAALPDNPVDPSRLTAGEEQRLFIAGDMATGGRVHLALESGLAAGERAVASLNVPS